MISSGQAIRAPESSVFKVAVTSLAASSIEWYDFFIYGTAAALVFPSLFFPADMPPLVAQIASFSTFAVGFVARPIGAVVFGVRTARRPFAASPRSGRSAPRAEAVRT